MTTSRDVGQVKSVRDEVTFRLASCCALVASIMGSAPAFAVPLNLTDVPLFVDSSKTALVQLVVERDNKLFFEAYPSYEDIDGDGQVDIRYDPANIDYYGYFELSFCYGIANSRLEPVAHAVDKKCTTPADTWSGDFLNYLTMTRMDIMLGALYGGKRHVDTSANTVLRRAFVPWEAHTWGIEYNSLDVDGYAIEDYSPLATPVPGRRHLLATNNFVGMNGVPYLRVRENVEDRIWNWVEKERTQGDGETDRNIILDVLVCSTGFLESNCKQYPDGSWKPIGLLHEYGENNAMYFSLLTGSYENNLQGGVLRQNMGSFGTNEVDPDSGIFLPETGIVRTLDALQIPNDYRNSTVQNDCGWIADRAFENGECRAWGNPIAEMMYEGMRYLAGESAPTPSFHTDTGMDQELGLPAPAWEDPYATTQPYAQCSSAYQLVISDPSPSFDGDQLPGSAFADFTESTLGNLDVGAVADFISNNEDSLPGLKFIGEADGVSDGSPSPKQVTTFRTIRGQSPEAPHRQGSYYAPSIAYHGSQNDLHPGAPGDQKVGNFTLALGSPLPTIDVKVNGHDISFAPFGKTVSGCTAGGQYDVRDYRPTNAIVGFVVESLEPMSGSFRVTFEDMEQGADNDMDALVRYKYEIVDGAVVMSLDSMYAAGCLTQHIGYSVSGTDADGVYLVVRDETTNEGEDVDYHLDVPPGELPGGNWEDGMALPLVSERTFTPSDTPAAQALRSPLWYAAKWGGFDDRNNDGLPQTEEWDSNGDGNPDNYFPVTNPTRMVETMRNVFDQISEVSAAATAVGVTGSSLNTGSRIYETSFRSAEWYGELSSHAISLTGVVDSVPEWQANDALSRQIRNGEREILTYKPSTGIGVPFRWPDNPLEPDANEMDIRQAGLLSLNPIDNSPDELGEDRVRWLRGEKIRGFRSRTKPLGDIVHSSPQLVGPPSYRYPDNWGENEPETNTPYSTFGKEHADRDRVVFVGANDGMLHAFDAGSLGNDGWSAGSGEEIFAYVPSSVYAELPELPNERYGHKYYVDATPRVGDVMIDDAWRTVLLGGLGRGGQGIFALDVTAASSIAEDSADEAVLWEFTDANDEDLGYTYTSPLIARMHNGRWAAIFSNGYNNSVRDDHTSADGKSALFIVDLEDGMLLAKLKTDAGSTETPNGLAPPTAVDLDNDNIVDIIYAGDLAGNVWKFDVRDDNPENWKLIDERLFQTQDESGNVAPITTSLAVGRHPTGEGVLVYIATGKYLEPIDQEPRAAHNRIYALWDSEPFEEVNLLTQLIGGHLLEQTITRETSRSYDSDGDGTLDTVAQVRESSREQIDWEEHTGWYIDLSHSGNHVGEQVVSAPMLRENRLILSTQIPDGDECTPTQDGWLMLLDAASGGMPLTGIDLDGNGRFESEEALSGLRGAGNPMAAPALVAGKFDDVVLSSDKDGGGTGSSTLDAMTPVGRVSWRELEP